MIHRRSWGGGRRWSGWGLCNPVLKILTYSRFPLKMCLIFDQKAIYHDDQIFSQNIYVARCNLGKVKIEASAGKRCPHGRDMRGRQPHFTGAPRFLQLTCLCQFISHLFTCRSLCCLSLLLPVPATLW